MLFFFLIQWAFFFFLIRNLRHIEIQLTFEVADHSVCTLSWDDWVGAH